MHERFNPENVQPSNLQLLDDAAVTILLTAKDHINEMTSKKIETRLPTGAFEIISPLEQAQRNNDQKQLDLFFQQAVELYKRGNGIDIKYEDDVKYGRTILFWAIATFRSKEYIASLLKINNKSDQEVYRDDTLNTYSPIFYAIFLNNSAAIEALLSDNPDLIMQESECGRTPAHYAAELRRLNILEILHKYNRKVSRIRTSPQLTPLHFVIEVDGESDDDNSAVAWLLNHDDHSDDELNLCDIGDINQVTALHQAIILKRSQTVCLLLQHGADTQLATGPRATPPNQTPLQIAASTGNNEIMRLLLQHGARPETRTEPNKEPAHPIDASKLCKRLQIALAVLDYRDGRDKQLKHKRTFLGITDINLPVVGKFKIVYNRQDKRRAVDALVANILNDPKEERDPLENLTPEEYGPLTQGDLSEIVKPLIEEHERLVKEKNSPGATPKTTPSPSRRSHE